MLNIEKKCIRFLSILFVGLIIVLGEKLGVYSYLYIAAIPLYIFVTLFINNTYESRERIELAVNSCIEESEFNVIDKIEQLRMYFDNTADVIEYLSVVESRVLTYVFNRSNLELSYKDYISGAIKCLSTFKNYTDSCYLNIDVISISEHDKISTVLSTLYMVSKQVDSGSSTIYITYRQKDDGIFLDVTDKYQSSIEHDVFCKKLLTMFSSKQFVLTAKIL